MPADVEAPLTQPPLAESQGGRLELTLTAAPGVHLAGRDTHAYGYNGTSPGPTLRVRPGDELAIRLVNQLDQPTNLHTHGLRVSPLGTGDNPFRSVEPGATIDYLIRIPRDHPPGTHWYHPHHHASAADQIYGGLAGALLVVPRDAPQDIVVAADRVLILSDTTLTAEGTPLRASTSDRMLGREGELLLINGQLRPRIPAEPGRPQRWRLVNACTSRILDVSLLDHPITHVAVDGNLLLRPVERQQIRLSPGSRADVLICPSEPGSVPVIAQGVARGSFGAHRASTARATVAVLEVAGTAVASAVPLVPAPIPSAMPKVVRRRVLTLSMDRGPGGTDFRIDGKTYDPNRVDQRVLAGTCEEWILNNAGDLAHPFHLHVWPFEVLGTSDGELPVGILQDVVLVPARGWARIRIPFLAHTGRSVFHCHIVDHSDAGMMGTIDVV